MSRLPLGEAPRPSSPDKPQLLGDSVEATATLLSVETVNSYDGSPFSERNSPHCHLSGHLPPVRIVSQEYTNVRPATSLLLVEGLGTDENDKVQPSQLRKDRRRLRDRFRKSSSSEQQEGFGNGLPGSLAEGSATTSTHAHHEHEFLAGGEDWAPFKHGGGLPRFIATYGDNQGIHSPTLSQFFSMTEDDVSEKRTIPPVEGFRAMKESQAEQTKHLEQAKMSNARLKQANLRLEDQIGFRELGQHELAQRYFAQMVQLEELKAEHRTLKRKYSEQQRAHKELESSKLDIVKERDRLLNTVEEVQATVREQTHFLDIAEAENASADRIADMAANNERLMAELEEARRPITPADPPSDHDPEQSRQLSQITAAAKSTEDDESQWMMEVEEHNRRVEARDLHRSQLLARMLSATRSTEEDEEEWILDAREAWLNPAGPINGENESNHASTAEYSWNAPDVDIQRPSSATAGIKRPAAIKEHHLHSPRAMPSPEQMRRVVGQLERQSFTFNADTAEALDIPDSDRDISVLKVAASSQLRPDTQMKASFVSSVSIKPEPAQTELAPGPSQLSICRALRRSEPQSHPKLRRRADLTDEGLNIDSHGLVRQAVWERYRPTSAHEISSMPLVTPGLAVTEIASAPGSPLPGEARDYFLADEDSDSSVDLRFIGQDTTASQMNGQTWPNPLSEINNRHEGARERQWLARHRRIQRPESHRTTATRDQQSGSTDTSSRHSKTSLSSLTSWKPDSEVPLNSEVPTISSNPDIRDHQQWQEQERSRQKRIRSESTRSQSMPRSTTKVVPGWHINPETMDVSLSGPISDIARSTHESRERKSSVPKVVVNNPSTAYNSNVSILSSLTGQAKDLYSEGESDTSPAGFHGHGSEMVPNSKRPSIHLDQRSDSEDKALILSGYSQEQPSTSSLASSVRTMLTFFDSSNTRFNVKVLKFLDGLLDELTTPVNSRSEDEAKPGTTMILKPRPSIIHLPLVPRSESDAQTATKPLFPIVEVRSEVVKSNLIQMPRVATEDFTNGAVAAGLTVTDTGGVIIFKEKTPSVPDSTFGILRVPENGGWALFPPGMIPEYGYDTPTAAHKSSNSRKEAMPSADNAVVLYTGRRASTELPSKRSSPGMRSSKSSNPSSNASESSPSEINLSDSMVLVRRESMASTGKIPQLMLNTVPESLSHFNHSQILSPNHLAGALRWYFPAFKASRDGKLWSMDFSSFRQTQQEAEELNPSDAVLGSDGHIVTRMEEEDSGSSTDESFHDWSSTSSSSFQWEIMPYHEIQNWLLVQFGLLWLDTDPEHIDENAEDGMPPVDPNVASISTEENGRVLTICDIKWLPCYSLSWVSTLASVFLFIAILTISDRMQMWLEGNDNVYRNADTRMHYKYVWAIPWLERLKYQLTEYIGGSELIYEVYGM